MLLIRSLVFDALLYALLAVIGIGGAPLALWSRAGAQAVVRGYCASALWLLQAICGLRTEVRGAVPRGAVIVCSKHQSFLDILILARHLPQVQFVMKRELRWAPVLGFYALRIGSTPLARGRRGAAMKTMVAEATRSGGAAGQLVIYPQGTRVLPGERRPFKIGAGVLYERLGRDCVPAATNAGVFWARRSRYRRPGVAVLEFLEPIPAGLPIADFMGRMKAAVEENSDRLMREAGFDPGPAEQGQPRAPTRGSR